MQLFQRFMHDEDQARATLLIRAIAALPEGELGEELDELLERMASQFDYPNAPTVLGDEWAMEDVEFAEGNHTCFVRVFIPFKGDPMMFKMCEHSSPLGGKQFDIVGQELVGKYEVHRTQIDQLDGKVEKDIEFLNKWLAAVSPAIPRYNQSLREYAKNEIEKRRKQLKVRDEATEKLKASGRIRKRNDGTEKVILPVKRKPIHTTQPKAASKLVRNPVPEIEMAIYEDILETLSSMALVMERSPSVFADMNEEPLRTILLVALNGIYQGEATGETFNGAGKTDILIRHENKNVFIAECLMWKGAKVLRAKMDDQLFQYAMWRDTKLALVIFNRGTSFSHVIAEMRKTVGEHPQCIEQLSYQHESGARYRFRRHDDPNQHFVLTCLAFDVPAT